MGWLSGYHLSKRLFSGRHLFVSIALWVPSLEEESKMSQRNHWNKRGDLSAYWVTCRSFWSMLGNPLRDDDICSINFTTLFCLKFQRGQKAWSLLHVGACWCQCRSWSFGQSFDIPTSFDMFNGSYVARGSSWHWKGPLSSEDQSFGLSDLCFLQ